MKNTEKTYQNISENDSKVVRAITYGEAILGTIRILFKAIIPIFIFFIILQQTSTSALAAPEVKNAILDVLTTDEIIVIPDDNENYTSLLNTNLTFTGYIGASMKKERAQAYAIFAGVCNGALCGTSAFKELANGQNDTEGRNLSAENVSFTFTTDKFPQGLSNNVQAQNIFAACKAHMSGNQPSATFTHNLKLTLGIYGVKYTPASGFETGKGTLVYTKSFSLPVTVNCQSLSMVEAAPKPYFLLTKVKKLGPALTCPRKIEVRTIIRYRKPATAKFRFYHNGQQSELINIKARRIQGNASHGIETHYLVERVKYYHVNPGQHSFRTGLRGFGLSIPRTIDVACKPFKASAMWLNIKQQKKSSCPKKVTAKIRIDANRPGNVLTKIKNQAGVVMAIESVKIKREGKAYIGRLNKVFNMSEIETQLMAEGSNHSALNSGWVPLKVTCLKALKGTLSFQDPLKNRCPRKAKVAFSIQTSINGNLKYALTCTGDRQWSGKVKAHKTGPNTYLATGVKSFTLKKHAKVSCALKTKIGNNTKIVALAGQDFVCNQGPSNDLADPQLPDQDGPRSKWEGEVTVADSVGGSGYGNKQCPRQAQVFFAVKRNEPGVFKYLMSCSNGKSFEGTKNSVQTGSHYKAFGTHNFNITKTRKIQCTLQEVKSSGVRVTVAKGNNDFTCANRNPDLPPASGDLTIDPRPQTDAPIDPPGGPDGLVAEPPKCSANERLVRGKCQKKPTVSILCKAGYKKVGNKCVIKPCKKGFKRVGSTCKKISIICPKGKKKVGNKCVLKPCKKGFKRVGSTCKKISIICPKGKKKVGNKCVIKPCRKGFKRVGTACKKVSIICPKGKIKVGNKCMLKPCKKGFKRVGKSCKKIIKCKRGFKKVGNRCVPKPCKKGKIRVNGKCIKPAA